MPCFQIWLFCHGSVICFTDGMIFLRFLSIQICFPIGLFIFCSNSKWPGKANCFHLRNTGSTPLKSFQGGNAAFGGYIILLIKHHKPIHVKCSTYLLLRVYIIKLMKGNLCLISCFIMINIFIDI